MADGNSIREMNFGPRDIYAANDMAHCKYVNSV